MFKGYKTTSAMRFLWFKMVWFNFLWLIFGAASMFSINL
jgi:hypothetical protein